MTRERGAIYRSGCDSRFPLGRVIVAGIIERHFAARIRELHFPFSRSALSNLIEMRVVVLPPSIAAVSKIVWASTFHTTISANHPRDDGVSRALEAIGCSGYYRAAVN